MKFLLLVGLLQAFLVAAPEVIQPTSAQAGAALAAGRLEEASDAARGCLPAPECALILGRAAFGLGQFGEAAEALAAARSGQLAAHAAKLQGEALLLARRPGEAIEPLRAAAGAEPDGPAGVRAAALLADALLAAGDFQAAAEQADAAEANLMLARALASDGRRAEAGPALAVAWQTGSPRVAAPAGLLLARDRARRGNDAEAVRLLDELARKYRRSGEAEESAYLA